jgi:hypothetical protein
MQTKQGPGCLTKQVMHEINGSRLVHPDPLRAWLATAWAAVHLSTCITQQHVLAGHEQHIAVLLTA